MRNRKLKKGFTLVELIVAVSIFSVFLVSITTMTINMYRDSRRISLQEQLYQDMRAMMRQITILIEGNAIDYEEYYRASLGDPKFAGSGDPIVYTYGDYAKSFYDFGTGAPPDGVGLWCNDDTDPEINVGCIIDKDSVDLNVGTSPVDAMATNEQDNLYLINENGDLKTILAIEPVKRGEAGENVMSILWLNGSDSDGDDVTDKWTLGNEFQLSGTIEGDLTTTKTEDEIFENFIPISPLRTNITNLKFYVSPLEDPYKAFAEIDSASGTLVQPHVTIVITAEPSQTELDNYFGKPPSKTLQTTIYSDVRKDVTSY